MEKERNAKAKVVLARLRGVLEEARKEQPAEYLRKMLAHLGDVDGWLRDARLPATPEGLALFVEVVRSACAVNEELVKAEPKLQNGIPLVWEEETDLTIQIDDERKASLLTHTIPPEPAANTFSDLTDRLTQLKGDIPMRAMILGKSAHRTAIARGVASALDATRVRRNTCDAFGRTWLTQGWKNLPHLVEHSPVFMLADRFRGLPAVIVGAGPSLSRNVHLLKSVQDRAVILCVSHALRAVQAAGCDPHFVFVLDPEDCHYHFDGCDLSRTALCIAATAHPRIWEIPALAKYHLAGNFGLDDWLYLLMRRRAFSLCSGGSVSNVATSMASDVLSCNPIVLIGQDLAYTNNRVYAAGTVDEAAHVEVKDKTVRAVDYSAGFAAMASQCGRTDSPNEPIWSLPGYYGGEVIASYLFSIYRTWFQQYAGRKPHLRLINCTEGGSRIEGWHQQSLKHLIKSLRNSKRPSPQQGGFDATVMAMRKSLQPETVDRANLVIEDNDRELRRRHTIEQVAHIRAELSKAIVQARLCLLHLEEKQWEHLNGAERALDETVNTLNQPLIYDFERARRYIDAAKHPFEIEEQCISVRSYYEYIIEACEYLRNLADSNANTCKIDATTDVVLLASA